ncbi:hypothetical protein JTE90_021173 [Oedothorax gibbosus]|uniref:Uncharacterized protein n=1 Tax=Oedothorax gibbosus TaxID=931172 RepID=A0AAV6V759_9ARAC|nr:hypothetical protein JTE90_021173 [Oedothorax gibbosus]
MKSRKRNPLISYVISNSRQHQQTSSNLSNFKTSNSKTLQKTPRIFNTHKRIEKNTPQHFFSKRNIPRITKVLQTNGENPRKNRPLSLSNSKGCYHKRSARAVHRLPLAIPPLVRMRGTACARVESGRHVMRNIQSGASTLTSRSESEIKKLYRGVFGNMWKGIAEFIAVHIGGLVWYWCNLQFNEFDAFKHY